MSESTNARLRRYVREYSPTAPVPTKDDLLTIEIRSDGYANAHVEGEHNANGICPLDSARECGERMAASEFVECG